MDIANFLPGHYEENCGYKYFVPEKVNTEWSCTLPEINTLLEKAAIKLGELNSFSRLVPNIDLFIQMHVAKEAVISSRIEGTRTQIDEALMPEEEIAEERRNDWKEVNNYISALNAAILQLETLPISSRLIRNTHHILLEGVRGNYKMPGEFRTSQNWIGGASLADARYIPPHHTLLNDLMGDLENFINSDGGIPDLIKIAIIHYQFETIHPFLDGNGRIGRLLITLYLVSKGILQKPLLYLSEFFEQHKSLYYQNLADVKQQGAMAQWIKFFLVGVQQTATVAVETLSKVLKFKDETENLIRSNFGRRSSSAITLLHSLLHNPTISIEQVINICDVSYKSANDLVKDFVQFNILTETTGKNRNRFFRMERYLEVFREG